MYNVWLSFPAHYRLGNEAYCEGVEGTGLRWKFTSKLEDLDFADDVALISSTQRHVQLKTNRLVENAVRTGLRVNVGKCKVMRVNARNNEAITVNGLPLEEEGGTE